ncbi:MAG: hypothetical protein SFW66_04420 [Gammaproteobacteria bacterium]|nr:hypothetical protein [Gammaproteobacteria bacterium]
MLARVVPLPGSTARILASQNTGINFLSPIRKLSKYGFSRNLSSESQQWRQTEQEGQKYLNVLKAGNFEQARAMLKEGVVNINDLEYKRSYIYGVEDHLGYYLDKLNYLKTAFYDKRLDIANFLLEEGANFSDSIIESVISNRNSDPEYVVDALKLIAKHQGMRTLYSGNRELGENLLHILAKEPEKPVKKLGFFEIEKPVSNSPSFTVKQIDEMLNNFTLDRSVLNQKNTAGETPRDIAEKTGNSSMLQWLNQNMQLHGKMKNVRKRNCSAMHQAVESREVISVETGNTDQVSMKHRWPYA